NNTDTSYAGTVHVTSSDASATLPADSTLSGGTGSFDATLQTVGEQSITATDTLTSSITGSQRAEERRVGKECKFRGTGYNDPNTAGHQHGVTVTALDTFNNTDTSYAGTVHVTSSDASATLPADSTLSGGTGSFDATLRTVGEQSITATDTLTSSITGSQTAITVVAAAEIGRASSRERGPATAGVKNCVA